MTLRLCVCAAHYSLLCRAWKLCLANASHTAVIYSGGRSPCGILVKRTGSEQATHAREFLQLKTLTVC